MDAILEVNRIMNAAIDRADQKPQTKSCSHCGGNGSKYVRGEWNPELSMYEPGEDVACLECSGKGFIYVEKKNV